MRTGTLISSLTLAVVVAGSSWSLLYSAQHQPEAAFGITLPTRRAPDAPPAGPPPLPAASEHVKPMTFDMAVHRTVPGQPPQTRERTVSRTAGRIHMHTGGSEWLFQRNVRDPRRVSGYFIDHQLRAIIRYEESDLRSVLGVRGWADVLTLGFDSLLLAQYRATKESKSVNDVRFGRYAASVQRNRDRDVWWSEELALPGDFLQADATGSTRFQITRIRQSVKDELLRMPQLRFPTYGVFDLADWLERH